MTPFALVAVSTILAGCGSSQPSGSPVGASYQGAKAETAARHSDTTHQNNNAGSGSSSEGARRTNYVTPVYTIQLAQPLARYTVYVERLARQLPGQVSAIESAASRGDVVAAQAAWLRAHMTYLEIGQDDAAYGSFGALGQQIDGLASGLPGTIRNPQFTGFHKVELDLWRRHDSTAAATDSARLLSFVKKLTPELIARDLPLKALSVNAWVLRCHEILEDGLRDSLSGIDDYGSNSDLASLSADVDATREMLSVLAPLITTRAPQIVPEARAELAEITRAITAAGGARVSHSLSELPLRQRQLIDADTSAALEELAPVSELMQVTTPGS